MSIVLTLPLDGAAVGSCLLTLHEARVFGQSWERLRMGNVPGLPAVQPVLPEARVLLADAGAAPRPPMSAARRRWRSPMCWRRSA